MPDGRLDDSRTYELRDSTELITVPQYFFIPFSEDMESICVNSGEY